MAFDGTQVSGRQAITAFMQAQFEGVLKGSRVMTHPKTRSDGQWPFAAFQNTRITPL